MKKPLRLSVTLDIPEGATAVDVKEYVKQAVRGWAGCLIPGENPMAGLDTSSVEVRRYKRRKYGSLKRQALIAQGRLARAKALAPHAVPPEKKP